MLEISQLISHQLKEVNQRQIFMVGGAAKSGTTWLQKIMDGNEEICCRGEAKFEKLFYFLQKVYEAYNKEQTIGEGGKLGDLELMSNMALLLTGQFYRWIDNDPRIKCVGDRTPDNALLIHNLKPIFPRIKFIHIIRDGRDVAVSGWYHGKKQQLPSFTQRGFDNDFAKYSLESARSGWVPFINHALAFGQKHPEHYFELRYESLLTDPEPVVTQLFEFLNVDASPEMVNKCIDSASFEKASGGRKPGEENKSSDVRKGIAGDWQNHFDESIMEEYLKLAGPLLKQLGYQ
jgi:hypothetical protein